MLSYTALTAAVVTILSHAFLFQSQVSASELSFEDYAFDEMGKDKPLTRVNSKGNVVTPGYRSKAMTDEEKAKIRLPVPDKVKAAKRRKKAKSAHAELYDYDGDYEEYDEMSGNKRGGNVVPKGQSRKKPKKPAVQVHSQTVPNLGAMVDEAAPQEPPQLAGNAKPERRNSKRHSAHGELYDYQDEFAYGYDDYEDYEDNEEYGDYEDSDYDDAYEDYEDDADAYIVPHHSSRSASTSALSVFSTVLITTASLFAVLLLTCCMCVCGGAIGYFAAGYRTDVPKEQLYHDIQDESIIA